MKLILPLQIILITNYYNFIRNQECRFEFEFHFFISFLDI